MTPSRRPVIAVAGATGFIGRALCHSLSDKYTVIGLTRRPHRHLTIPKVKWRCCDLFSTLECEQALEGVDVGIYLVHSMISSARLTQGGFQDMDLILADNFARAARHNHLSRIIFLGGIIPPLPIEKLSRHLRSRLEVEQTLRDHGMSFTALRASIVIGPYGTSFSIFRTLLHRMPIIPCPTWSRSRTQPIALENLVEIFHFCLEHPLQTAGIFDVGCPEIVTYRQLLERTAALMKRRRFFFYVPLKSLLLCKLWLRLISGAPMALIAPLVESMRFEMTAGNLSLQKNASIQGMSLDSAIEKALTLEKTSSGNPPINRAAEPEHYDVRSVQRLPLPPALSARAVVNQYLHWMPWIFRWIMHCREEKNRNIKIDIRFFGFHRSLLDLTFSPERSLQDDRQVYYISGGLLVKQVERTSRRPRLEFREMLNGRVLLLAIHNYRPSLPPWLYSYTQALIHLWGTHRFALHLKKKVSKSRKGDHS